MKRMNLCTPRPGKDRKTFWNRIGTGFVRDDGSISITFDALPTPTMHEKYGLQTQAMLFPHEDKGSNQQHAASQSHQRPFDDDSEVPF